MNYPVYRLSDEKLLQVLLLSPIATAIYTGEDVIIQMANDAMLQFWNKDRSIIGLPLGEAIPKLKDQPFIKILQNVWQTGTTYKAKDMVASLKVDGKMQTFYFDFTYQAILDEHGKTDCILHTATDVTERNTNRTALKKAQQQQEVSDQELQANQLLLNQILAQLPTPVVVLSGPNHIVKTTNKALLQFWQKEQTAVTGKPVLEVFPELKNQVFPSLWKQVLETGEPVVKLEMPVFYNQPEGKRICYVDFHYQPIKDLSGTITSVLVIMFDNTEKVKARRAIEESEKRFRSMAEGTDVLIAIGDETSNATYLNKAWTTITGRSMEELLQFGWADLVHPEDRNRHVKTYLDAFERQLPFTGEFRIRSQEGNYRWLLAQGQPRLQSDGSFAGYISSCVDITERKVAEQLLAKNAAKLQEANEEVSAINEELRASNEELQKAQYHLVKVNQQLQESEFALQAAFEAGELGSCSVDLHTLQAELSPRFRKLYGLPTEGTITWDAILKAVDPQYLPAISEAFTNCIRYGSPVDSTYPINNLLTGERRWVRVVGKVRNDANGIPEHVYGIIMDFTEQVKARQAIEESEQKLKLAIATGKMGLWSIDLDTMRISMSEFVKNLLGILPDQVPTMNIVLQAIDKEYHPMLLGVLKNAIEHYQSSDTEYSIHNLITGQKKWVRATGQVFLNVDGKSGEYAGMFIDITEQKQDDERKNDFIGMVSHELKTPLTSINGYIQLLQVRAKKAADLDTANLLQKSYNQVKRMTSMINGFLNVSRLESGKIQIDKTRFSLDALIQDMIDEAADIQPQHVITFSPCNAVFVHADRDKIGSVISNLISNAIKYSPNNRSIEIICELNGNAAQVSVKDNGIGINPQDVEKLFERYYRVNSDISIAGFGIGLYLSAEIVNRHSGKIWVQSEPGSGSTFLFSLPAE